CRVRVAAVETVPAEPENTGAGEGDDQVVRLEVLTIGKETRADHCGGDETGNTGRQMDDVTARVVRGTRLREPAAAPQAERADRIYDRAPDRNEDHPGFEVHASENRARDQQRRDGCEHELEPDHCGSRETQRRQRAGSRGDYRLPD